MKTFSRMLVAVDGSESAAAGIRLALRLAKAVPNRSLRFISVFDRDKVVAQCAATPYPMPDLGDWIEIAAAATRSFAEDACAEALGAKLEATATTREGRAVEAILDEARTWEASCIVVGTHGRRGIARALLGSTAESVLRRSEVPVLITRPQAGLAQYPLARILCAVDDSPAAQRGFDTAVDIAAETHSKLSIVSIVSIDDTFASGYEEDHFDPDGSMRAIYRDAREATEDLAIEARLRGVSADAYVHGGTDVAKMIVALGRQLLCGLIVIGTHGRNGVRRAFLGSTAEAVIRSSGIPVLALREPREAVTTSTDHVATHVAR